MGPNWKIRVARAALEKLGINGNAVLRHGIEREVYAVPLATNWQEILLGGQKNVRSCVLPASEIADFCFSPLDEGGERTSGFPHRRNRVLRSEKPLRR